jgi:methionyl-tRNA formyltransferase
VIEALTLINQGEASFTKQSEIGVTYAEKISRDEERINFNESATDVNCKIRGLSPRPGAYFVYNNEIIKIIAAEVIDATHDLEPGVVVDEHLNIACGEGIIRPILLQRQGKKMMYTDAFLRGFSIPANTRLSQHSLIKTTA